MQLPPEDTDAPFWTYCCSLFLNKVRSPFSNMFTALCLGGQEDQGLSRCRGEACSHDQAPARRRLLYWGWNC